MMPHCIRFAAKRPAPDCSLLKPMDSFGTCMAKKKKKKKFLYIIFYIYLLLLLFFFFFFFFYAEFYRVV